MKHIKIFHVITGLNTGGAEMMLYKLLAGMGSGKLLGPMLCL